MKGREPGEGVTVSTSIGKHLAFAPVGFAVTEGPAHELVYANAIFLHLQASGAVHLGASQPVAPTQSTTVAELTPLLDQVYRDAATVRDAIIPTDDDAIWSCTVWPVPASGGAKQKLVLEIRDVHVVESAKARQREVAERLVLSALRDQDFARAAEAEQNRAQYLSKASRDLSLSLDEQATRDTVRRLTLPRPGTWCIVDVVESNGSICRLGVVHPDPSKQELARKLEQHVAEGLDDAGSAAAMMSRKTPSVISHEAGAVLMLAAHGKTNLAILREIGFAYLLVVPLVVRARVQGTITFVSAPGDDAFTSAETAVAVDVASRCALALDNARLYREADGLRRAAEAANKSKSEFLGGMSHELRTPLNAIGGFAELMEMEINGPVTDEQRHALARIKSNQQHLLMLITEILNFVRIESGRMEYKLRRVPVGGALREVADMLGPLLAERGMSVDLSVIDPGAICWADADRVRQILVNLLTNAVKYGGARKGVIRLTCGATASLVTASVSDMGPGIEEERRESIFEPFVQLASGLTERRGGVGLGLAISRDLARAMGGDLTVESVVGAGSTFTLSLPLAPTEQ